MIALLGYPLEAAVKRLEESGYTVKTREARSRKGVAEGERRVVRLRQTGDSAVQLTYSTFRIEPNMP